MKNNRKNIFALILLFFLILLCTSIIFADTITQGQIYTGYTYIDLDTISLNFLPYLNVFFNYKKDDFEMYISNEGYYLLNSIFNEKIKFNINYSLNNFNKLFFGFSYEDYNLPQLISSYDSYNLFLLNFGYTNIGNNIFTIKNESKYIYNLNSTDTLEDSLILYYIVPTLNANYYTYFKAKYESLSDFSNIYTNINFDVNGLFFVKNNQLFTLGIKGEGGYSFGKNQGNYFDIDYYNKISAILSSVFSYSTEFDFRYKYFLNIIDASNEKNFYVFSEKFSLFYSIDNFDLNISNMFYFYFYPDTINSNYLEYLFYFNILSNLSETFLLKGETSANYRSYYLSPTNNVLLIYINLGIVFDNKKDITISFNNKFGMNFEQNNNFTTNETEFIVKYCLLKDLYINGLLNYKITYNSSNKTGQQYFYIFLGVQYNF